MHGENLEARKKKEREEREERERGKKGERCEGVEGEKWLWGERESGIRVFDSC